MDTIKLKGFTISRQSLEERFGVKLDDGEWYHFKNELERSWDSREFSLEKVVVDHIKNSLFKMDYKATIEENKLKFVKKDIR